MNTATLEAPPSAADSATENKFDWAEDGSCLNSEVVTIDLGGGKLRHCYAVALLGQMPDGTWRCGYRAQGPDDAGNKLVSSKGESRLDRLDAIKLALQSIVKIFGTNKQAIKALEGYHAALGKPESLPANKKPSVVAEYLAKKAAAKIAQPAAEKSAPKTPMAPLPKGRFAELPAKAIHHSPENARKNFDGGMLQELAESIRLHGLLQPIAVRKIMTEELPYISEDIILHPKDAAEQHYEIILGARRFKAHGLLKRDSVECKIYEGVTRQQAKAAALVENLQRVDLNPIEEAEGYRDLMEAEGLTQDQCASRVGRSRPAVANALRILDLPASIVDHVRDRKLTTAHAVAIARFKEYPAVCEKIAELAVKNRSTASDLEKGLPFGNELANAKLVVDLQDAGIYSKREIPKDLQKDPSVVVFKHGPESWAHEDVLCLDIVKGTELIKVCKERRKAEAAKYEVSRGRTTDGKMTEGAKKERAKKIAENKKNRADTQANLDQAFVNLKSMATLDKRVLAVVIEKSLSCDYHYKSRMKVAAEKLGIKLPAKLTGDSSSVSYFEKLAELSERDMVWLAAGAILLTHGENAIACAHDVPDEIAHVVSAKPASKSSKGKAAK